MLLQPTGVASSTATDVNGKYTLGVPSGWAGTIAPLLGTNAFVPGARTYPPVNGPLTLQNYLVVPTISPTLDSSVSAGGTNLLVSWTGVPGVTYQLWSSTNLVDWLPLGNSIPGTNGVMEVILQADDKPMEFVRVGAAN